MKRKREREMKENFDFCLQTILKHEGGFVDHPKDPGGATNKGITKKTYENYLRKKVSVDELKEISDDHINGIYSKMYWVPIKGNDLPHGIDLCVFDWAVNSGPRRACKELQSIIGTTTDGVIGPITLSLVENYTPTTLVLQGTTGGHTILTANNVDISAQPAGTSMIWKIATANQSVSKDTRIHAVSLGWS